MAEKSKLNSDHQYYYNASQLVSLDRATTQISPVQRKNRRSLSTLSILSANSTFNISTNNKSLDDLIDSNNNNRNTNGQEFYYVYNDKDVYCTNRSTRSSSNYYATQNKASSPNYSINYNDIEIFNRLNRDDLIIDNKSWLSEKPISVLQLDPADRAVLKIADQRDKIQTKTFTKWINKHLRKLSVQIEDLFVDLRNGVNLVLLLELLTNRTLKKDMGPLRFHWLQNIQTCLNFLTEHHIKIVNIRPDEIVDGNPKLTLGLIWIIILHFQISEITFSENSNREATAKDALMLWVNRNLDYCPSLIVKDFCNSWKDGRVFLAILHRYIPDKINLEQMYFRDNKQNLQIAFDLAESEFKVTKLLDPEDVDNDALDEKSLLTYIASLYDAMPRIKPYPNNISKEKRGLLQEYSMLFKSLNRWLNESINQMDIKSPLPNDYIELKGLMADFRTFCLEDYKNKQKEKTKITHIYSELQNSYSKQFSQTLDSNEDLKILDKLWDKLDQSIQNRENQLKNAISKTEKMKKTFDRLNRDVKNLGENLNLINEQITTCLSKINLQSLKSNGNLNKVSTPIKNSTPIIQNSDILKQIDKIKLSINQYEKEIRQHVIEANQLHDQKYPNSNLLLQRLSKLEQLTIDIIVKIDSSISKKSNELSDLNLTQKSMPKCSIARNMDGNHESTDSPQSSNASFNGNTSTSSINGDSSVASTNSSNYNCNSNFNDRCVVTSKHISSRCYDSIVITTTSRTNNNSNGNLITTNNINNNSITNQTTNSINYQASSSLINSPTSTNTSISLSNACNDTNENANTSTNNNLPCKQVLIKTSSVHTQLNDLLDDALKWIKIKQNEINTTQYKLDITMNELELSRLRVITNEINKFHTNLDQIELLKMDHANMPELNAKSDETFLTFNFLCKSLKLAQQNLESLIEFNKLVQDELRYIGEMEDIELNRDWSQPNKFKSSDLIQHKLNVELTLNHKKQKINLIVNFAQRLIELKHPASDEIKNYLSTLSNETNWLHQLMNTLNVHIGHLQNFEKLEKEYNEVNNYVTEMNEKFKYLTTSSSSFSLSSWNSALSDDFTNQFNIFKHNFQMQSQAQKQIDDIYAIVNKLPAFKMRKMNLKSPYDRCEILTDYSVVGFKFTKGELCKIEDNANPLKWKVLSLEKNRDAFVPSVCFVLNGPDLELMDLVDKLKFKYEQLNDDINRFDAYLKKENISRLVLNISNESQNSKFITNSNRSSMDNIIESVKQEEVDESSIVLTTSQVVNKNSIKDDQAQQHEHQDKNLKPSNKVNSKVNKLDSLNEEECDESSLKSFSNKIEQPDLETINSKLTSLYEKFEYLTKDSFVTIKIHSNRSASIKKIASLEIQFQNFQQIDCKNFENEMKEIEINPNRLSSNNKKSHKSSKLITDSNIDTIVQSKEFKTRLAQIKSKYKTLINLSDLYSKSFSNLDSLSAVVDKFVTGLCTIETQLDSQSNVEINNVEQMKIEMDVIGNLKKVIKTHEKELSTMKTYYEELKKSSEKFKDYQSESTSTNKNSEEIGTDRHAEDLKKLNELITQLNDRWNSAISLYTNRRNNLKKCLYTYQDYIQSLKNEKQALKPYVELDKTKTDNNSLIAKNNNNNGDKTDNTSRDSLLNNEKTTDKFKTDLLDRKNSIETCNKQAAQFVILAKDLNEQLNSYKIGLLKQNKEYENNENIEKTTKTTTSASTTTTTTTLPNKKQNTEDKEFLNLKLNSNILDKNRIDIINQSLHIEVCNQINDLNNKYLDLLQAFGDDNFNENTNNKFLTYENFIDSSSDFIKQKETNTNIDLINIDLNEFCKMNYKDFCGSQEFNHPFLNNKQKTSSGSSLTKTASNPKQDTFFFTTEATSSSSQLSSSSSSLSNKCSESSQSKLPFLSSQTNMSTTDLYNFYNSSLISDYRLTLTDLIELNLVDISNGLIINPLNGARLTIADAIRIDLLNSDVKEVANTFLNCSNKLIENYSQKLTVKEAIQYSILNPTQNEIYLSNTNPSLKLNLYDARKRNLILKPLTLSEAFIRNLIQPNGFVRNPINNKYYAFETLITNDLNTKHSDINKLDCDEQPMYLFDFDTKHIIDPNDSDKRLLSLSEAIEIGLILPRTFQLNLNCRQSPSQPQKSLNLYDAFFNTNYLSLSLLLYKPEVENVYIKLATNLNLKNDQISIFKRSNQLDKVSIILSRREKIGLIEAINLNVINLKNQTYTVLVDSVDSSNLSSITISLEDAIVKYKLVDSELIDLLNTSIGIKRSNKDITILDCINESSLQLDKYLYKNPFNNELMQLDSHSCRVLLGEETIKKIKRLITRINIKSYIISLNTANRLQTTSTCSTINSSNSSILSNTQLINFKTPNVVYNKIEKSLKNDNTDFDTNTNQMGSQSNLESKKSNVNDAPIASYYFGEEVNDNQIDPKSDKPLDDLSKKINTKNSSVFDNIFMRNSEKSSLKASQLLNLKNQKKDKSTNDSLVRKQVEDISDQNNKPLPATSLVKETKSYILDYVYVKKPVKNEIKLQKLNIPEAKRIGVLNVEKGLYVDEFTNQHITIDEAIEKGLIGARVAICEKNFLVENEKIIKNTESSQNTNDLNETLKNESDKVDDKSRYESSTLTIESIIDAKTGQTHSISEAIKLGILDQSNLCYKNTLDGKTMPLNEAFLNGFIKGNLYPVKQSQNSISNKQEAINVLSKKETNGSNKCILNKNPDGNVTLIELEEKSLKIKTILDPKTQQNLSIEQAVKEGLFDKCKGVYIEPISGQSMTLNEALICGYIQAESPNKDNLIDCIGEKSENESNSILVIDIKKSDKDKQIESFYKPKQLQDTLLYEVRELEEVKSKLKENSQQIKNLTDKIEERIEQIVDDDDENYDEDPKILSNVVKRRSRNGLKPNIIERRIPSLYESQNQLYPETLIIDDVRHSAMLDIDGITHVFKNEVLIDTDEKKLDNQDKLDNSTDSISSLSSSSISKINTSSMGSLNENTNIKKLNNRTVIVVDDQLITSEFTQNIINKNNKEENQVIQANSSNYNNNNNNSSNSCNNNNSYKYETLKIQINKTSSSNIGELEGEIKMKKHNSAEFLTNSERAQFERKPSNKNNKSNINEFVDIDIENDDTQSDQSSIKSSAKQSQDYLNQFEEAKLKIDDILCNKDKITLNDKVNFYFDLNASNQNAGGEINNKNNENLAKQLLDELNNVLDKITEFETDLARQNPLSDRVQTVKIQQNEFNTFNRLVNQNLPIFDQVLTKCKDFSFDEANKTIKIRDDLIKYQNDILIKLEALNGQIIIRRDKLENAYKSLEKFSKDHIDFMDGLNEIEIKLKKFENITELNIIKENDLEIKSLENVLASKISDLNQIRTNLNNYANITDSFTKDLQGYSSKLKNSRIKRLSSDFTSDLSYLKSCMNDCELKYQQICKKIEATKSNNEKLINQHDQFSKLSSKFEQWLKEIEHKTEHELKRIQFINNSSDHHKVKELEDLCDKFNVFKSDIKQEKKSLDEINKCVNNLESNSPLLKDSFSSLENRYNSINKLVSDKYDNLIDQLTSTRNLKENFDQTTNWLNEVDQLYLNPTNQTIKSNELSGKDEQIETYERIKSELTARKDALIKNAPSNEAGRKTVEQLLSKIDLINRKVDLKSTKLKSLQKLLDQFNTNYEKLNIHCKRIANKLDSLDVSTGQFVESKQQIRFNKIPNLDTIQNSIKLVEEIRADIEENENKLLNKMLKPCLKQIESQFVSELFPREKLDILEQDLTDIKNDIDQLITCANTKLNELDNLRESSIKYSNLKNDIENWLHSIEVKIDTFEPIGIDVVLVEKQYKELESVLVEYESKSKDLEILNNIANVYSSMINKQNQIKTENSLSAKLNVVSKRKRRNSINNRENSRHSSVENLADNVPNLSINSSFENDLEQDLVKLNDLYDWIGQRLDERKKDLLNLLDQMKSYLDELKILNDRLIGFEENLTRMFNLNEIDFKKDLTTIDLKLPLQAAQLSNLNNEFKHFESDLNKFNLDIESVKLKGKQFLFDRINNDVASVDDIRQQLKELNDKYCRLNSTQNAFKDKLEQFTANFNSFDQTYGNLSHNLEQKQQMLNIMSYGALSNESKISLNCDTHLIDAQIKQIELLKNDLAKKDSNLLDQLNRNGEYLIDSSLKTNNEHKELNNKIENINSNFDLLSNQLNSTLEFKNKFKELCLQFTNKRQKFYDQISIIDNRLNEISKLASSIKPQNLKNSLNELNTIENDSLKQCHNLFESSQELVMEIIDLTRGNLILNGYSDLNLNNDDELNLKLIQMKTSLESTCNTLSSLKSLCSQTLAKEKQFNSLYSNLKDFINKKVDDLNNQEGLSTNLNKLTTRQKLHESFVQQLVSRSDEVKKLIEYYSEYDDESNPDLLNETQQLSNEIETVWNDLCSKSDAFKEKLFICYSLSEQFENVYSNLDKYLDDAEKRSADKKASLESQLTEVKGYLNQLNNEQVTNFTKLSKIGNELKNSCQLDQNQVDDKIDQIKNKFKATNSKYDHELKLIEDEAEKDQKFNQNLKDLKNYLGDVQNILNSNSSKSESYKSLQENLRNDLKQKLDLCKELADTSVFKNENKLDKFDELKSLYDRLDNTLDNKIAEDNELDNFQKELSKMDDKLKNIEELLGLKHSRIEDTTLESKKNHLSDIRNILDSLNNQLKSTHDNIQSHLVSSNPDQSENLSKLQETILNLNEKCAYLNSLQIKEEESIKKQSSLLKNLEDQIEMCNKEIMQCFKEFDQSLKPFNSALTKSSSIQSLIKEQEQFEEKCLIPIKEDLEKINKEFKDLVNSSNDQPALELTSLELHLEKLNSSFNKLDSKFKDRAKQLDVALFKSSKFEDKIKILNENLQLVESNLDDLTKVKFTFGNLDKIEEQLNVSNELIKHLLLTSNEIDEFKEICERIIENCDDSQDRDIIEKRMDNLILKWNLLTRQLDERKNNLNFLNLHLNQLNLNYLNAHKFVNELNVKFTSNLVLNCIDPIVIKCQYEKMRELNDIIIENFYLINDLKLDASNLLSIDDDYENKNNQKVQDEPDELDVSSDGSKFDNKYLSYLPKSISISALHSLVAMLDKNDIESNINNIDNKYNDYKFLLGKNLNLMHRLYPLCEKYSQTVSQLNQSVSKFDSDLDWLNASSDNETSQKDKENLFNDIKKSIVENEDQIINLEGPLSARIIDELNTTNSQCDEFITDLNDNINLIKHKFKNLNDKLESCYQTFESRKLKSKELYGEIDDLLEWLDEVDTKLSNLDGISHDPEIIQNQITEQLSLNEEISKQKLKLKEIHDNSKILIRGKFIDDSIELKEKLNGLHIQTNNLFKTGSNRLNELEQAFAISQNFTESYQSLSFWFDEVSSQLEQVEKQHNETNSNLSVESKELIKQELNLLKQIDRNLQERKIEFESMNKNGIALIKICNKNNNLFPFSNSYGGSMILNSNLEESGLNRDCQSAIQLKQLLNYANQRYETFKKVVNTRKDELENILWLSAEFSDKLDNLTNNLNTNVENCEYVEPISAHPDKLRLQIEESKQLLTDLEKRKRALEDLKEQLNNKSNEIQQLNTTNDPISSPENLERKINELDELWYQLKEVSENRAKALEETLDCSETFWSDFNGLMEVINDLEERLKQIESETVAIDPDSVIEQQQYHEQIVRDIDENEINVNGCKDMGSKLIELCGQFDQPEVQKTVEELDNAWNRIKKLVRDREVDLQHTFGKACEFQQELIEILEWISLQQEKFVNLDSSFTSNDPKTIRFQINLLKEFKEQVDPEQLKVLLLNQKFNDLKSNTKTNQSFEVLESLQEPLNSANKEWKRLQSSIVERKSNLQNLLLEMGQFNEALDEMLKWLDSTNQVIDEIELNIAPSSVLTSNQLVSSFDIQLARLKVLQNDIKAQEQSVDKLKETGKNLIKNEATGKQNLKEIKQRLQLLIDSWENLLIKLEEKQNNLNNKLNESQGFQCELQDVLLWLSEIESNLISNKPFGGLPETAREQLEKFMLVYHQIELNESTVNNLIQAGNDMIDKNKLIFPQTQAQDTNQEKNLNQSIENLCNRWNQVKRKADDRKEKLNAALNEAIEFNNKLQKFIAWLTETEKTLNMLRPVSRVLDSLTGQISEHQILQKNISEHRDQMLDLDRLGTHLKYFSQKQDVILIKNLLISVQNRWEKIVSRSAERTRDLERGYKEAKQFYDVWKDLLSWLNTNINLLNQEQSVIGNNPSKIKQLITKHKEFHRILSQKQPVYDSTIKIGRKLIDKCESDQNDRPQIQEMLNELKNKWQALCLQSVERQKKLEDALLCSGQFRDALQSLLEWLSKVEPTLAENTSLNGDLDNVIALIEDNQQFQQQLQHKAEQVALVRKAANDLVSNNNSDDDISSLNSQLEEMNDLWSRVDALSKDRTVRLELALKLAKEFNVQVRSRLEWLNNAEQHLKLISLPNVIDNENEIVDLIENHQNFVRDLQEQEVLVKQCLDLGHELLNNCIPEAVINLKHWIVLVQSRWDEVNKLCDEKTGGLNDALEMCKENENLLGELLAWLQGAEATLTALEQKPIVNNLELVEQLLQDHQEFQNEMQSRQVKVERITKMSSIKETDNYPSYQNDIKKKSTSIKTLNKTSSGWRTPEPKMRNPRVKLLFDRWRKVWLLSLDRQRKLKEAIDRLKEMERLKNFSFDEWRRRYMNWHKDNRARITDFFRRQDRDHDGKISREEFIEGILSSNFPSSRLELEAVADIFDLDKDGFIDYKEFLATLKPTVATQPNVERIRDEVQRQVSLCKCSKRYHVLQISERHYRFGDSQKLRLVRILQSTVMVRVGGGWMALDEFLVKNDPCRAKGRTNFELRDQFLLKETPIFRSKSPARFITSSTASNQANVKPVSSVSRSGGSSSTPTYGKRTPHSSLSQSNEVLMLAPNSPNMPSGTNSHSGSLGASISDLSSDATSEFSDNYNLDKNALNKNSPNQSKSKGSSALSGTSTPNKTSSLNTSTNSRLPVPKKN